ncbi:hypothetical protein M408DRAFT_327451 [Serendipita vermifera MAFF 305830]|uniref:BTB domain-containing protein n=1 Tax=Serendipita vermifera MAFF 305830 TaxID=933852 RepID=A0A0C2XQE0_SERVB|nr:hypothetical protein M408DRAFT_327451 [Serendipita vermifera MAFF 305830]
MALETQREALPPRYSPSNMTSSQGRRTQRNEGSQGTNDVRLLSSDGVPIYTSRALLAMISPVFRDMYELGPYTQQSSSEEDEPTEINMAENSGTLAILLAYADPTTLNPPTLNISQLFDSMAAAQKYLMEGTLSRLRTALNAPTVIGSPAPVLSHHQSVTRRALVPESPQAQQRVTTLLLSSPLPAAVLCHTFGFIPELRLALRELARVHIEMITSNNQDCILPAVLFQFILKQRRARATWFKVKAKLLFAFAATTTTGGCTQCMRYCAYAVHDACAKMDEQPSWEVFKGELHRAARCSCGAAAVPVGNERFQNDLNKWEIEARTMEAELPVWPQP